MTAADGIRELIRRDGPIPFDWYVERCLYEPEHGFFARGRGPGRSGRDFVTSPETGPLFGVLVARAIDGWWRELGEPDPFVVIDAGAGTGALARSVLRAAPQCAPALRYVMVERSAALRALIRDAITTEPPDEAIGPFAQGAHDEAPEPVERVGPIVTVLDDLPAVPLDGVIVAHELLDNLPFGIARWMGSWWDEVRVGLDDAGGFAEVTVPLAPREARVLDALHDAQILRPGTDVPIPRGMVRWLEQAAGALRRCALIVVDYSVTISEMNDRPARAWLRTYHEHGRGADPFAAPGAHDITSDVVSEQLERAAQAAGWTLRSATTQADWLSALGIDDLVAEGQRLWAERAHVGDLAAIAARSRGSEAAALTDPDGLGGFLVSTFTRGIRG